jgi:hypothetical protein
MNNDQQRQAALAQIKAIYLDGVAEVNGRAYKIHKMQHMERRKVFAFYSGVQQKINSGDFGFFDSPAFAEVEKVLWPAVSLDGELISKRRDHWEEYPEDYINLVIALMGVMSYPFLRASGIALASQAERPATTTLSKPM